MSNSGTVRWTGRFAGGPIWVMIEAPVGDFATGQRTLNWLYTLTISHPLQ